MARPDVAPTGFAPPRAARVLPMLLAAMCLLAAAGAAAQPTAPDPEAAFLPLWQTLPDRSGWRMLVSPAFPGAWPPPAGHGTLVRYAFAMRLNPAVADGAEMTAPWARSTRDATGATAVERLSAALQPLGIQGVRPLRSSEIALLGREPEVDTRLLAGGGPAMDGVVRAFTCGWIGRLGVVAATITPRHPGFTRWLACGRD